MQGLESHGHGMPHAQVLCTLEQPSTCSMSTTPRSAILTALRTSYTWSRWSRPSASVTGPPGPLPPYPSSLSASCHWAQWSSWCWALLWLFGRAPTPGAPPGGQSWHHTNEMVSTSSRGPSSVTVAVLLLLLLPVPFSSLLLRGQCLGEGRSPPRTCLVNSHLIVLSLVATQSPDWSGVITWAVSREGLLQDQCSFSSYFYYCIVSI